MVWSHRTPAKREPAAYSGPPPPRSRKPLPGASVPDFEIGVHRPVTFLARGRGLRAPRRTGRALLGSSGGLVHLLARLGGGRIEGAHGALELAVVRSLERFLHAPDRGLERSLLGAVDLVAVLLDQALGLIDALIGFVAQLDRLAALLVLLGVRLGLIDHTLHVVLGQTARGLDADRLLLARGLVLGAHVQDAVGVDVEGHLDL